MNGAFGVLLGMSVLLSSAKKEKEFVSNYQLSSYKTDKERNWVDSVYNALSPRERAAQTFIIAAYSNKNEKNYQETQDMIARMQPGGIIFFQGGPVKQAHLTNRYQAQAKVPMFISGDYEWGLSMRLDSTFKFPWQMTLGAIQNTELIREVGLEMARQLRRIGVNFSYSPVLDVNNNPANPIIGARSFGESKHNVTQKGIALTAGLQQGGVLASGKHFPGHGDTDKDSHKDLPIIPYSQKRLDTLELFPFKALSDAGIGSIMVGHLYIPSLDSTPNLPSSLSKKIITEKLRIEMGFDGLILTDALNMKGVSAKFPQAEASIRALNAGVDILLMPENPENVLNAIMTAIDDGRIDPMDMEAKVKRILKAKYRLGLTHFEKIDTKNIKQDLFTKKAEYLNRTLFEHALTLVKNENNIVPIKNLENENFALVRLGNDTDEAFANTLNLYTQVDVYDLSEDRNTNNDADLLRKLKNYSKVFISIHKSDKNPWRPYKIYQGDQDFIKKLSAQNTCIITLFANAYALKGMPVNHPTQGLIIAYQNNSMAQEMAAQLIFGGIQSKGRLPISINETWKAGFGLDSDMPFRFKYTMPEELGVPSEKLDKIEAIVKEGIAAKAFPGCQILAAKHGKVVYYKSFGHHTYDKKTPVKNTDLYDLASVTKVTSTLAMIMKMYDEDQLNLKGKFGDYVSIVKGTNKENIKIEDLLTHQAGLKSWIPFYLHTMNEQKVLDPAIYSRTPVPAKTTKVADSLYILDTYRDTMFVKMYSTALGQKGKYEYSDLSFYFLQNIVENWKEKTLDVLVQEEFYKKIGATTLTFKPLEKFPKERIVPTENETYWRKQLLQGYVHDQGAAMMGGVAGHAGLFSNANDLAKMMQMYLNKGVYGGHRYFKTETVEEFSKCRFCANGNRRALGFDRAPNSGGTPCECVSYNSYGHTGFTGTMVWMDPETNILYVFLSNRVHPSAENKLLMSKNIRARIQEVIYNALQ